MNILSFRTRNAPLILFVLVVMFAAYIAGLFVDVTRDASKYATIAREICETGDFIHLQAEGEPYLQKPPLLFWLSALSFSMFGVSNFAFKFPLLLFSFLGFYSAFRLGKSMYGWNTGVLAAVLYSTAAISFLYNMDIHTDTLMQALVIFSLWQLYDFLQKGKWMNWLLGFTGVGLAMLVKGPVGAVVPAFAVTGYLLFTGQFRRLLDPRWYIGILLSLIIILPGLIGLFNQFGWDGVKFFFWSNNLGRLAGDYTASDRGIFYFAYNLMLFVFPWTLFLLVSLFFDFRKLSRGKFRASDWFLFSGIWFYFILISLSGSKLPHYIHVTIPLFSILTARYLSVALSGHHPKFLHFLRVLQVPVLLLLLAVSGVLVSLVFPLEHGWQWLLLLFMVFIAGYFFFSGSNPFLRLVLPSLTLSVAFFFFINQHAAPGIFADQAPVKAAALFNRSAGKEDKIYNYNYFSHELNFYSRNGVSRLKNDVAMWNLLKEPGNWILTTREVVERMPDNWFPDPEMIPLSHVWINKLNVKYLDPATRASARDTLFLLKSAPPVRSR